MAKVSFTKLIKIKSIADQELILNDEKISIKQFLPLEDKITLIQTVIEAAGDEEQGFFNIIKLETYYIIEMLKNYTNINFTEKQINDITKTYDLIMINSIWDNIKNIIPEKERTWIWDTILSIAKSVEDYQSSVLGIIKNVVGEYGDLSEKTVDLSQKITSPEFKEIIKNYPSILGIQSPAFKE